MKKLRCSKLVLAFALSMAPAIVLNAENSPSKQMPLPKADVYVVPAPKDLPIDLKYPAKIRSFQDVKAYSRVLGVLEEKFFKEGESVNKGDLLFKIEDDIYKAKVQAAQASYEMSQASLENAKRDWERIKRLYKTKTVSDEKRDTALFAYEKALSAVALAKAQLSQAKIDLEYTNVKAPISGITGMKLVDIGDLVTQNPPKELVKIRSNDKVYVDFSMPLSDYKNIKNNLWAMPENKKIDISLFINNKETKEKGIVDFIDVNIDQATSTVKMRALVENKEYNLMPGNFVRVALKGIVQKDVITIPQKAVLQNTMGKIVMIENNGIADVRPVVIGKESGDKYVVTGGPLKSNDRVIVNNFFRVKPGKPLQVDKIINK